MSRVLIESLGCKLNQAESESLLRQFLDAGHEAAESHQQADICILNTCTVTHIADRKARQRARWMQRHNPGALLIATGCYAQRAPEELARLGVTISPSSKNGELLLPPPQAATKRVNDRAISSNHHLRTRALVKIQQGCNDFCAFCIVPLVRGAESSLSPEQIIDEIKARVAEGYQEVVLTGTKIGAYQWNGDQEKGLSCLTQSVLRETNVGRLHLSSLQPQELTPELLDLWRNGRLCNHLHIPLQSGSDRVLQRMGRRYSTAEFEEAVSLVKKAIPDVAITIDIMVGFPGETEPEFEESYRFCQKMNFANIHVFPYSARQGTEAAGMSHQIGDKVKRGRAQKMLALAEESAWRFRAQFLERTVLVLWEREVEEGVWSGLTSNYIRVFATSEEPLTNCQRSARLVSAYKRGIYGELV